MRRAVAQLGSASDWGSEGRGFKSRRPDGEVRQVSEAEDPGGNPPASSLDRVFTIPNVLSATRILLIPVFIVLLANPGTEAAGLLLLGFTVSTDWVDGYIARRTGQVSNLGKILDPVADRLAIAAALVTLMILGAVPVWAGVLVLVRDAAVLAAGGVALWARGVRIDVRPMGKLATLCLMVGIPCIAWAGFDLWGSAFAGPVGWIFYGVGIVLYYAVAVRYAADVRAAFRANQSG